MQTCRLFIDVSLTFSLKLSRDIIRLADVIRIQCYRKNIGINGDSNVDILIFPLRPLSNERCQAVTRFYIYLRLIFRGYR